MSNYKIIFHEIYTVIADFGLRKLLQIFLYWEFIILCEMEGCYNKENKVLLLLVDNVLFLRMFKH